MNFPELFKCPWAVKCIRLYSKRPVKLKAKGHSSQEWLRRQMTDPYVEKAKMLNYRCRSYAKLCEIDDKFKVLRPGYAVVDCGAAPGSWSQVAVHRCNADASLEGKPVGTVIGVDLLPIFPFKVSFHIYSCFLINLFCTSRERPS